MAARPGHAGDGLTRVGAVARLRERTGGWTRRRSMPVLALAAVSLLSLGARAAWLGQPCHRPCRSSADHSLIFDEIYYMNAARAIAAVPVPAGSPYAGTPAGMDPNSEHPQLAKLLIAASIKAFGDGPFAWRLGSLLLGSLAILGLFVLVRAADGGPWTAVGACALMAADNLLLVHGRIATLDIYVLAPMIWGVVMYLRGRHIAGGVLIGIAACVKLVAPFALLVLVFIEALRAVGARRTIDGPSLWADTRMRLGRLGACTLSAAAVFMALLAVMDRVAPPYDPNTRTTISAGPLAHIAHMFRFAADQRSPHGPAGIASYPWQWWADVKPIVYLNVDLQHPTPALSGLRPAVHFLGVISPPILLIALPGLVLAARRAWREARDVDIVAVAWCVGTFLPLELLSVLSSRTSYLYYMVIVLPGVYVAVTRLLTGRRGWLVGAWLATVLLAAVLMYPFTPLPAL